MEGRVFDLNDKSVVVTHIGALTALGDLHATWEGLVRGVCALARGGPLGLGRDWPTGKVPTADGEWGSPRRVFSILDQLLDKLPELPEDTSLVAATTKGAVDELLQKGPDSLDAQPWNLAEALAEGLGLTGAVSTVSAACASGALAVIQGAMQVLFGECPVALALGVDVLSRFVVEGFASLQALSAEPCRPFDKDRRGLSLGEGAAFLVLVSRREAERRGWPVLASVTGWGIACDATHITAPDREARGLVAALRTALQEGKKVAGCVNAHGTGTVYNDAMEALAFETLWKGDQPPVCSIKGAIGHCLGAAGVIEAALSVLSLEKGCIPPTVSLEKPLSNSLNISGEEPLTLHFPSALTCNSGFGGINAAILFET